MFRKIFVAIASAGLLMTAFAAPARATADYTATIDCDTFAGDGLDWMIPVGVVGGSVLELTMLNCDNAYLGGGTAGMYFLEAPTATGDATITVNSATSWSGSIGSSGNAVLTARVITNLNESYPLDYPVENGRWLFTFEFGPWDYNPMIADPNAEEEPTNNGGKLGKIKFGPNSPVLTASAQKKLRAIAKEAIDAGATTLKLKGFTSVGIDASWSVSQHKALAKARAAAVKAFLKAYFNKKNADIAIKIVAKGKANPVAANTNEKNRSKNRRVEVWAL